MKIFTAIYDEKPIRGNTGDVLCALNMNGEVRIYYNCQANGKILDDSGNAELLIPDTELLTKELREQLPMEPQIKILDIWENPRRLKVCIS